MHFSVYALRGFSPTRVVVRCHVTVMWTGLFIHRMSSPTHVTVQRPASHMETFVLRAVQTL